MIKKLLFLPVVGIGVLVIVLMSRGRQGPSLRPDAEAPITVRVLEVPRMDVRPRALGYGVARPGRVWQAVPQVGGRIVELSPRIREGNFVLKDALLVRIDRSDYDLEVAASEARLAALRAQLAETTAREATIQATLAIEERSLELAEAEVARIRSLVEQESIAEADLDKEMRTALAQRQRVQEMRNNLSLLPPQRGVLEAQIEQETAALSRARLAVERTEIRAPFALRIGPVQVEQDQVIQAGQVLFQADGIDRSEVTAWIPLRGLRGVLTAGSADVATLNAADLADDPASKLGLEAVVRLVAAEDGLSWPATVVRVRGLDARTRALGLDVAVEKPYEDFVPGRRPPLARGMYVEVEVRAPLRPDEVVVPRSALHDDHVYLVDEAGRLRRRTVQLGFLQSGFAIVRDGLEGGEVLVLSDVVPAVDGTLLDPQDDAAALETLEADAAGRTTVR